MIVLPSGRREFHVIDQIGGLFSFWREIKRYSFDQIDSLVLCKNDVSQAKIEFPDGAILDMSLRLGYNPPYGDRADDLTFQDCFTLTFADNFDWTDHLVKEV